MPKLLLCQELISLDILLDYVKLLLGPIKLLLGPRAYVGNVGSTNRVGPVNRGRAKGG